MIVRYSVSIVKGEAFALWSESYLQQYLTNETTYKSADESVATIGNKKLDPKDQSATLGVITAVGVGRTTVYAYTGNDEIEVSVETLGIEVDYDASGATIVDDEELISFENQREIKFVSTPGYIIRTKLTDAKTPANPAQGIIVEQPTDTTVIVKATEGEVNAATLTLDLVDRHSKYVGIIKDLDVADQYFNLDNVKVTKTYDQVNVKRGVKIWDSTNKCYRYVQAWNESGTDTGDQPNPNTTDNFYDYIPKDATFFYESIYTSEAISVEGIRLPDAVGLTIAPYYEVTAVTSAGKTGEIAINSSIVTTDSVRLSSWPMDLGFVANEGKTKFLFDLNTAIPYNYKLKLEYGNKVVDYPIVRVLGDRLVISKKPVLMDEETGAKAYVVEVGEVSAVEFYSNPKRDMEFIEFTSSDEDAVELFNVGTVKLARFNTPGKYNIYAKIDSDGKPGVEKTVTIQVIVLKDNYTVTFNSNGGSEVSEDTVKFNQLVAEPTAPTKEGFTFKGWYKDEEFTTAWNFDKDTVTEDVTLYAKWLEE